MLGLRALPAPDAVTASRGATKRTALGARTRARRDGAGVVAAVTDMIIFDLICKQGHVFEGWFDSAAEFDRQKARHLVACPMCDDVHIERRPSAKVKVAKVGAAVPPKAPKAPKKGPATMPEAMAGLPAELVAKLREVVRSTEDVGERFPEEARKIHYDEVPQRPIRGRASAEDAQALRDEGIEFTPLPPFLTGESH